MFNHWPLFIFTIILTKIITIFISSCSINGKNILPREQFVVVLAELMVIERLPISENEKLLLIKKTFDENKVTSDQFYKTREQYSEDPDYWISVYDDAKSIFKVKADSLARKVDDMRRTDPEWIPD
jgi:hypothetical protein